MRTAEHGAVRVAEVKAPGRFQVIDRDPLPLVDGAHHAAGMHALAEALAGHREPFVAVVSVLDSCGVLGSAWPAACCGADGTADR